MGKIRNSFIKCLRYIKEGITAIMKGELMLRLNADKYILHIAAIMLGSWSVVLVDIMSEHSMAKLERNKRIVNELKIEHAHKTVSLVKIGRLSTLQNMLERSGSDVTIPDTPPAILKK